MCNVNVVCKTTDGPPTAEPAIERKTWTVESMRLALEALEKKTMNLSEASSMYHIPITTLWDRARHDGIRTTEKTINRECWDTKKVEKALDAIRSGTLTTNQAAKTFGLPPTFLYRKARAAGLHSAPNTSWSEDDMQKAMQALQNGEMSVTRASSIFRIPISKLRSYRYNFGFSKILTAVFYCKDTIYARCKRDGIQIPKKHTPPFTEEVIKKALDSLW